jgi:hypothetical protein
MKSSIICRYDPIATAKSITHPMLVLQARRDYQVTNDDFQLWKQLDKSGRVTYKEYAGLNHLMMTCEPSLRDTKATPEEYSILVTDKHYEGPKNICIVGIGTKIKIKVKITKITVTKNK